MGSIEETRNAIYQLGERIKEKKAEGKLPKDKRIVITVTGNGLKDVGWILDHADAPTVIPVDVKRAAEVIGLA
jgi:threonine synthase